MEQHQKGKLILADGSRFDGFLLGTGGLPVCGEVVFNTSMVGYQEVITDPSYAGQIVVMTYPQIGNYGVKLSDSENARCAARALVVRDLSTFYSRAPGRFGLESFMRENKLAGLTGIDTRALTRRIRSKGVVIGVIGSAKQTDEELMAMAKEKIKNPEREFVDEVSGATHFEKHGRGMAAVVDLGAKKSIIKEIKNLGVGVMVFNSHFSHADLSPEKYDFVVLSNGPGDPTDVVHVINNVEKLAGKVPILGICLGHQVAALALGGDTYKLKFGHRGANQPVTCHRSGRVFITSQNHGYAVADSMGSLGDALLTYTNANDGTVEGFSVDALGIHCVQFHPEASPGPHDTTFIFGDFYKKAMEWKLSRRNEISRERDAEPFRC